MSNMFMCCIGIITSVKRNATCIVSDIIFLVIKAPRLQCSITFYISRVSLFCCSGTFFKDDFQIQINSDKFEYRAISKIIISKLNVVHFRSSPSKMFFEKGILKICSKFAGEHPC